MQLTGSAGKGRHSYYYYYYYYHCNAACDSRYKAAVANEALINELQQFVPKPGVADLYKMVIRNVYSQQTGSQFEGRKELLNQIQAQNDTLAKARKLLLDDAIDSPDYKHQIRL